MFHRDARGRRIQAVSDDFVATYLDETVRAVRALDGADDRRGRDRAGPRARRGRAAVHPRAWAARPAHASHAVNDFRKLCALRGLHADRQRRRADRARERRGLGHQLRRLAGGVAPRPARRGAGVLRRRRQQGEEHLGEPGAGARARGGAGERRVRRRRPRRGRDARPPPRRASSFRRCRPTASRRTPRDCARWSGTCWSATRRSSGRRPSGNRRSRAEAARLGPRARARAGRVRASVSCSACRWR